MPCSTGKEFAVLVDTRLSWPVVVIIVFCFIFPFLADWHIPLFDGMLVRSVEDIQAILLLFFAGFSFFYIKPFALAEGKKQFWLWAVLWWVLLFGRSTSWGRDYFPEVPRIYFHILSVLFIAPVVFMLFSSALRSEIAIKFRTSAVPVWAFMLAVAGLIISDGVEHGRFFHAVFLHDLSYKDLIEELYEFPLILGLFMVTFQLMKNEVQAAHSVVNEQQQEMKPAGKA